MTMTMVFCSFAAVFSIAGWLLPHTVHRLGYRMAAFYLAMAVLSAIITLLRQPSKR